MSTQDDLRLIQGIINSLDNNRIAKLAYTDAAFVNNIIDGVEEFDVDAEQNIPKQTHTDLNDTILNKGVRSQGASLPRDAFNHYLGRASFNINKIAEQLKRFFGINMEAWAHNAAEYDSAAAYKTGDVCYTVEMSGDVRMYAEYQRTSVTPVTIQNIPPTVTLHWTPLQTKTASSALIALTAPGYRHRYTIVNLTGENYNSAYWYPVVTDPQDFEAKINDSKNGVLRVLVEAYCNGLVAGRSTPQRAELRVLTRFTGFDASSTDIVMDDSFVDQTDGTIRDVISSPIGYSKLVKGRQAVVWLRGGSTYALWNTFGSKFTLYPDGYSNGLDAAVTPQTVRTFSVTGNITLTEAAESGTLPGTAPSLINDLLQTIRNCLKWLTNNKAPLASPALTGTPTAPTAATTVNNTQVATMAAAHAVAKAEAATERPYATVAPVMDGTAAVGTSAKVAREDHTHPTDTTRAPLASPALTGTPTAPTAATTVNNTQVATMAAAHAVAKVEAAAERPYATVAPVMDGTAAVGTSAKVAREDHTHPTDTTRASTAAATTAANGLMSAADKLRLDNENLRAAFYTGDGTITTEAFLQALYANGAFNTPRWTLQTTWSYATNPTITDTGIGDIDITGSLIEVFTLTKSASVLDGIYKIRITTSPVSSPPNGQDAKVFLYLNHGPAYLPGWRKLVNTTDLPGIASTSANGFMAAAMVTKLNGIATGATANAASSTTPKVNGTAAAGIEAAFARGDHVHPVDSTRAPLASPALTGTPTAPTAAATVNNTQVATMAAAHAVAKADSHPVGSFYTQFPVIDQVTLANMFPASESPGTLFGGTWTEQYAGENVFFKGGVSAIEANRGKTYNTSTQSWSGTGTYGVEEDAIRNFSGQIGQIFRFNIGVTPLFPFVPESAPSAAHAIDSGTTIQSLNMLFNPGRNVPVDTTNHPKNRIIKVWKRTA